jgi:hypothetical protein
MPLTQDFLDSVQRSFLRCPAIIQRLQNCPNYDQDILTEVKKIIFSFQYNVGIFLRAKIKSLSTNVHICMTLYTMSLYVVV